MKRVDFFHFNEGHYSNECHCECLRSFRNAYASFLLSFLLSFFLSYSRFEESSAVALAISVFTPFKLLDRSVLRTVRKSAD